MWAGAQGVSITQDSQAAIFARAYQAFSARGLLSQSLRLGHGERIYSVRCDNDCLSVYRINDKPFLPPGLPGWIVCRLSRQECFSLDQEEQACQLHQTTEQLAQAAAWLVLELLPPE